MFVRSPSRLAAAVLTIPVLAGCGAAGSGTERAAQAARPAARSDRPPNIVFVLTDDLSTDLLRYMPAVRRLQRDGTSFSKYVVSDSLCCPSRTSILTGLLPHNSGVWTNVAPHGGVWAFRHHHDGRRTFAAPLRAAGYRTALFGKYLNGYRAPSPVPRGWTDWKATGRAYHGFDYTLDDNGRAAIHGSRPRDYFTDVLATHATQFVDHAAHARQPFFLELSTFAPHPPAVPAPRDARSWDNVRAPRGRAFDRATTAAPRWLANRPGLTARQRTWIDTLYRQRVRSLGAVNDLLNGLRAELRRQHLAGNTYIVFSSDNGFHMGEHRLAPGKKTAFDTDIRVPLIVAGPGVRRGRTVNALTQNTDLAPTFVDMAKASPLRRPDGRSLLGWLDGRDHSGWRRAALVEHRRSAFRPGDPDAQPWTSGNPPSYDALRLPRATYVEYADGEREYYDDARDPAQVANAYRTLSHRRRAALHRQLVALRHCHGARECA